MSSRPRQDALSAQIAAVADVVKQKEGADTARAFAAAFEDPQGSALNAETALRIRRIANANGCYDAADWIAGL